MTSRGESRGDIPLWDNERIGQEIAAIRHEIKLAQQAYAALANNAEEVQEESVVSVIQVGGTVTEAELRQRYQLPENFPIFRANDLLEEAEESDGQTHLIARLDEQRFWVLLPGTVIRRFQGRNGETVSQKVSAVCPDGLGREVDDVFVDLGPELATIDEITNYVVEEVALAASF